LATAIAAQNTTAIISRAAENPAETYIKKDEPALNVCVGKAGGAGLQACVKEPITHRALAPDGPFRHQIREFPESEPLTIQLRKPT
jgi:hypothetical protein